MSECETCGGRRWILKWAQPDEVREPCPTCQSIDLVSQPEIAERLGVTTNTVHVWRQRHKDFPAPEWVLGQAPIWRWTVIEKWAKNSGRIK